MKFVKTNIVTNLNAVNSLKVGQWFSIDGADQRGQYLGTTTAGVTVVRWQKAGKFERRDAVANKHLRAYAKVYGA